MGTKYNKEFIYHLLLRAECATHYNTRFVVAIDGTVAFWYRRGEGCDYFVTENTPEARETRLYPDWHTKRTSLDVLVDVLVNLARFASSQLTISAPNIKCVFDDELTYKSCTPTKKCKDIVAFATHYATHFSRDEV